jgi:hypothetical protein
VGGESGKTILTFVSEDEAEDWVEAEGQLSSMISVRSELARGDQRALYLGWLLCAQNGDLDVDELEPPVPAGLGQLSASLGSFADFLRIDTDLIDAAAAESPPLVETEPKPAEIHEWVAKLPVAEKNDLLAQLMGGEVALGNELIQRMRRERTSIHDADRMAAKPRTVAALLRAGERAAEERRRVLAEKTARENAERERATARARAMHLDRLAGKELTLWAKVDSLIAIKLPKTYDQAVELLADLRDLAARKDEIGFQRQIQTLRATHVGKRTLIARLDKAGL